MFMSNKVSKTKTDQQAMSASGLPRNEKSSVRDDILAAAKTVKSKKAGIGASGVAGAIAGASVGRRMRAEKERKAAKEAADQKALSETRRKAKVVPRGQQIDR